MTIWAIIGIISTAGIAANIPSVDFLITQAIVLPCVGIWILIHKWREKKSIRSDVILDQTVSYRNVGKWVLDSFDIVCIIIFYERATGTGSFLFSWNSVMNYRQGSIPCTGYPFASFWKHR